MISHSQHTNHGTGAAGESAYNVSRILSAMAIGAGALMLAPHILPAIGIGNEAMALASHDMLHGASGLAGGLNSLLGALPVVGAPLAEGGMFNALMTGTIGIGGVLLSKHLSKTEGEQSAISWGRIIEYTALATSAMIALPVALSSVSSGILYMAQLVGTAAGNPLFAPQVARLLTSTLGTTGIAHASMGFSGVAAIIPHFFTCGIAMVPAALALQEEIHAPHPAPHAQAAPASSEQDYADAPILLEIKADKPLAAGVPCVARLTLKNTHTGKLITPQELAVVHTEKLHLFVTDSSLKDYHHIHPKPTSEPGVFTYSFTPATSNNYRAWADFTLLKTSRNHKLKTEIPSPSGRSIPPVIRTNTHAESNGLSFDWKSSEPLRKDTAALVEVDITDASGKPVTDLEPIMGAFAHLVGFSANGTSIIHTHPMGPEPSSEHERGGPKMQFHVEPDCAGATQFYLQVKHHGQDIYVPFGQQIQPPAHAMKHTLAAHQHTSHSHHL